MLCTVIAQCAWYVQQFCSLAIFEQMQISTAEMIAFTPAAHKVGSGQFGGFSLAEGLWLEFTEVHLMKFPVDLFASWIICFSNKSTVQTLSSVRAGSWALKGDWLLFIYTKEKKKSGQSHRKHFQGNNRNQDKPFNAHRPFTPFSWTHKVLDLPWSTSIILASCVLWHTVADGEFMGHMNSLNFLRFVFPDSNPTGNPKSGGTHSWWSEGKLEFFIPFPHHRHIHVIAESIVCHTNLTKHFNEPKMCKARCTYLVQQHSRFSHLFVIWQTFPDHSQFGKQRRWKRLKYSKLFGKVISGWQIMTVHARGADTYVTKSLAHLQEK